MTGMVKDIVFLLLDTALLTSGFMLEDPTTNAERIHWMIIFFFSFGGRFRCQIVVDPRKNIVIR